MSKFYKLLGFLLFVKLLSIGIYDLYDSTEARYAGIAFRMAQSGDFITPWFLPNIPFWGKPPLSFWITALSFKIGYYNEFFARLPHFLTMILVMFIGFVWVKKISSKQKALIFCIMFASTAGFIILAGSVMTDAALLLGITLINFGFYFGVSGKGKKYGYLFFLGLCIAMLSKGLVGIVLTAIPCFLYCLFTKNFKNLLNLPIITGSLMFLIITLPWFILMERSNSGFLEYFFVGEHLKRFLVSGWEGDKYGYAHKAPFFTIIPFFFVCTLPWGFYALYDIWKRGFKINHGQPFLILTLICPLIFFAFSRNIILPYGSIAIVPFCMLLAMNSNLSFKTLAITASTTLIVSFLTFGFVIKYFASSDKSLVKSFQTQGKGTLYYIEKPDFSSYFYSKDALVITSEKELYKLKRPVYFVANKNLKEEKIACNKEKCLYLLSD